MAATVRSRDGEDVDGDSDLGFDVGRTAEVC